jgi:hypothetical protein
VIGVHIYSFTNYNHIPTASFKLFKTVQYGTRRRNRKSVSYIMLTTRRASLHLIPMPLILPLERSILKSRLLSVSDINIDAQ